MSSQRKRGIQASRSKLTRALNEAGLASQIALAERIADLEGLETTPKDMVNRAFREQPVEARSLDRIARALEVDVHTLYKSSKDPEEASIEPENHQPGINSSKWLVGLAVLGILITALMARNWTERDALTDPSMLDMGNAKVGLLPIDVEGWGPAFIEVLRGRLSKDYKLASETLTASATTESLGEFATRLSLDVLVEVDVFRLRRLVGMRVFAYHNGVRQQIWAESYPAAAITGQFEPISQHISDQIGYLLTESPSLESFPLAPVQEDYLWGEFYLDEPSSELNIKRAESRFQTAIRQAPNYAKAHAGLCQALLEAHWMFEEERMLEDARSACSQAIMLDADDPVTRTAQAHFLRRTGAHDESLNLYVRLVDEYPDYPSIFAGWSAGLLDLFRHTGNKELLAQAKSAARKAGELDGEIWKPFFNLGLMEWFDGDVHAAISANLEGLERHENEKLLANLGTLQACVGEFAQARDAYLKAQELAPHSYVGNEFLGMIYYLLGDYEESIRLRKRALESVGVGAPEIHEMWGQLADALRHNGDNEEAIETYRRAAEIAERDHTRGTLPIANEAARAYYYIAMQSIDAESVNTNIVHRIVSQLDSISASQVETTAHRRMAQAWLLLGQLDKARASLEKATVQCPGYRRAAEFAFLIE